MNFHNSVYGICIFLSAISFVPDAYSQSFLTNGLTAYYPFNGNAHDESGRAMDGAVNGATLTTDRFGVAQRAYRFNGSSWIQLPDAVMAVQPPQLTMSAWVLADGGSYASPQDALHLTSRTGECGLGANGSQFESGFKLQTSGWVRPGTPIITNEWIHLVGIYQQGQYVQLYVNGALASSIPIGNEPLYKQTTFPLNSAIGIYDYTGGPYQGFVGAIDEVRFYNRALSASEVQALYQHESGAGCVPSRALATPVVINGFVIGATLVSGGCGYTSNPRVLILGGGGTGAAATAVVSNGVVIAVNITNAGFGYTDPPTIFIYGPLGPQIGLRKAVQPSFTELLVGSNYQLQVSADMNTWTNQGPPFTATNAVMNHSQYWNVDDWSKLFFRLQPSP